MNPKAAKFLEDIRGAAAFIEEQCRGKDVEQYQSDRLLRQAVERNFITIGEALSRLRKVDPDSASKIARCARIVAFRNVLIHAYDVIDDLQVWEIVVNDLPALHAEVTAMLAE